VHVNSHNEFFKSTVCGFDQWSDDHWGYDADEDIEAIIDGLEKYGYKYKVFAQGHLYAYDSTGWGM